MLPVRFPLVPMIILMAACTSSPPPSLTQAQRDSLTAEVRETTGRLLEAMNAHDPESVLSFYKESGEFVYLGCTEPLFGFEPFAVRIGPYYRNSTDVTFHQEILMVQILTSTTAVVTLRGGSTETEHLFWTEVLVKEDDGRWLIAHEHESWPACSEPSSLHPTGEFEG